MSPRITKILLLSVLLGILSGLGGILFHALLELVSHLFLHNLAGYDPPRPAHEFAFLKPAGGIERRWLLALLPAAGGLLCGALVYWLAPEAAGHGSDAAIEAYHFHDGKIRYRVPFVKLFSAALTIGSGGSGGAEGPITQIGAGIGSWLADKAKLSPNDRRTFMAAGMASGIAAIFRAPLAGALFSAEVLYKDLDIEHEVLVPAFISSTVAYSVFGAFAGWEPLFETPHFVFDNPGRLIPYAVLACVESAAAIGFIKLFYALHDLFARLGIPPFLKPALGGLCCGIIGYFIPDALGTGYGVIQEALGGKLPIIALLIIAGAKMFTTSFSI
ncbi:chloride channel protein, partial [Candidatus Sumerlaeota bacterium]|nr:chloride channel protein [Candidatus Sumerlaeota bacterium]